MKLFKKKVKSGDSFEKKVNEAVESIRALNNTMVEYYKEDFIFKLICEKVNNGQSRI